MARTGEQLTIEQALAKALEFHNTGRPGPAENLYRQILAFDPRNANALHFLGVLLHQGGQHRAACDLIRQSLAVNSFDPHVYFNLGVALQADSEFEEAIVAYRHATAINPNYHQAHNNIGNLLTETSRPDEAIVAFYAAIGVKSDYPEAFNNLGNALKSKGQIENAMAAYQRAISLRPGYAEAWCNLGIALRSAGHVDEAIAAQRRAIGCKADYAEAYFNLGLSLQTAGRFHDAIAPYQQAVALKPAMTEALFNLANALREVGRFDESLAIGRRASAMRPNFAEGYCNLGATLLATDRIAEAIATLRHAVMLDPRLAAAACNLGVALQAAGKIDDAVLAFEQAIAAQPDFSEAHYNLASALLTRGDFTRGFDEYEWRLRRKSSEVVPREFGAPQWDGRCLNGTTLLLHAEQGFGDTIQFIRYLPLVKQRGGTMVLQCQPQLERLIRPFAGECTVVAPDQPLPHFDWQCPLLSLAKIFGSTLETIPSQVPYLRAEESAVARWRGRLSADAGRLKIGLVWGGSATHTNDRNRSLPISALAPLAEFDHISFYSLQKGEKAQQLSQAPPGLKLIDPASELGDFADTAALITCLDLVLSVDTAVAHLAGAMGKPTWVLLPFAPDWRWLLQRGDSPWYPTMRLFRQPAGGDWNSVLQDVAEAILKYERPAHGSS